MHVIYQAEAEEADAAPKGLGDTFAASIEELDAAVDAKEAQVNGGTSNWYTLMNIFMSVYPWLLIHGVVWPPFVQTESGLLQNQS